jgi:hypothetical protein
MPLNDIISAAPPQIILVDILDLAAKKAVNIPLKQLPGGADNAFP